MSKYLIRPLATVALLLVSARRVDAQLPWPPAPSALGRYLDAAIESRMERTNVPGVVCAVVTRDAVLVVKGHGVADLASKDPAGVDTAFRVGSISKVVTALAALQLIDGGKIDANADVNAYVAGNAIPDTFDGPVNAGHLLTHTGGFDERLIGASARHEASRTPLAEYVHSRMPPRVRPPGTIHTYSNHEYTLLGYLVESVAKTSFEEYATQEILGPLGMKRSGFRIRPEWTIATGYDVRRGKLTPGYDVLNIMPAGSLVTTASDMAALMRTLLRGGELDGVRVISETGIEPMLTRQFGHDARLPGRTWGLAEHNENGLTLLNHDGLIRGFGARMLLSREHDFGIFVAANVQSMALPAAVCGRFLDQYFPERGASLKDWSGPPPDSEDHIREISGSYRHTRYSHSTFAKFSTALPQLVEEVRVARGTTPGTVTMSWAILGGSTRDLVETAPYEFHDAMTGEDGAFTGYRADSPVLFRRVGNGDLLMFRERAAYVRLRWWETRRVLFTATGAGLLGSIVILTSRSIRWLIKRTTAQVSRRAKHIADAADISMHAALLAFAAGLIAYLLYLDRYPYVMGYGPTGYLIALLVLPLVAVVCAPIVIGAGAFAWRTTSTAGRIVRAVSLADALLLLSILNYWNLLGFRFG